MTPLAKGGIAIASIGTIGGGAGLVLHLSNKYTTVENRLTSEGFELASADTEWDALLKAHNLFTDGTNIFKVTGSEKKDTNWLKNKCSEALKKEDKDNTNYLLARQWCVKETDTKTIFGKGEKKYKILNTVERDANVDKDKWITKINSLKQNNAEKQKLGVTLEGQEGPNIIEIKKACATTVTTKTTAKEFNTKLELARSWCAI